MGLYLFVSTNTTIKHSTQNGKYTYNFMPIQPLRAGRVRDMEVRSGQCPFFCAIILSACRCLDRRLRPFRLRLSRSIDLRDTPSPWANRWAAFLTESGSFKGYVALLFASPLPGHLLGGGLGLQIESRALQNVWRCTSHHFRHVNRQEPLSLAGSALLPLSASGRFRLPPRPSKILLDNLSKIG